MKIIIFIFCYFTLVSSTLYCNSSNCTVLFEQTFNSHTIIKSNLIVLDNTYLTIGENAIVYIEKDLILSPISTIIFNNTYNPIIIGGEFYINGYISTVYDSNNIINIELFKFNGSNTNSFRIIYDNGECKLHKQLKYHINSIYININRDVCNININQYLPQIIAGSIGLNIIIIIIILVIIACIRKHIFLVSNELKVNNYSNKEFEELIKNNITLTNESDSDLLESDILYNIEQESL